MTTENETQAPAVETDFGHKRKTLIVKISGVFLRDLFDIPGGVVITGAFMDGEDLALIARSSGFPADLPHQTTTLMIRHTTNRRGQQFDVVLWPGYEASTLEEYGLAPGLT